MWECLGGIAAVTKRGGAYGTVKWLLLEISNVLMSPQFVCIVQTHRSNVIHVLPLISCYWVSEGNGPRKIDNKDCEEKQASNYWCEQCKISNFEKSTLKMFYEEGNWFMFRPQGYTQYVWVRNTEYKHKKDRSKIHRAPLSKYGIISIFKNPICIIFHSLTQIFLKDGFT